MSCTKRPWLFLPLYHTIMNVLFMENTPLLKPYLLNYLYKFPRIWSIKIKIVNCTRNYNAQLNWTNYYLIRIFINNLWKQEAKNSQESGFTFSHHFNYSCKIRCTSYLSQCEVIQSNPVIKIHNLIRKSYYNSMIFTKYTHSDQPQYHTDLKYLRLLTGSSLSGLTGCWLILLIIIRPVAIVFLLFELARIRRKKLGRFLYYPAITYKV